MSAPIDLRTSTNPADREIDALRVRIETLESTMRGIAISIHEGDEDGSHYGLCLVDCPSFACHETRAALTPIPEPIKPAAPLSAFATAHAAVIKDEPTPAEWATFEALKQQDLSSHAKTGKDERQGRNV